MTWLDLPADHPYGIHNLPYGVFSTPGTEPRVGVRVGDHVLDVGACAEQAGMESGVVWLAPSLNAFLAEGRQAWSAARAWLVEQLTNEVHRECVEANLVPVDEVTMHLPVEVADYVDFYASEHHATNVGRIFRPDSEPLTPNWKHLPIGYHGRSGNHRRLRHRHRAPQRAAQAPDRAGAGVRAVGAPRHRGRAGLRRRRRHPPRRAGGARGCRRAPLRCRPPQRLVGPRPAGLGVRAARPVPRQVVRHLDLTVGRHDRCAAGGPGAATRPGPGAAALPARRSRPTTARARPTGSTCRSRSTGTARSSPGRSSATCTGRPRRWWRT